MAFLEWLRCQRQQQPKWPPMASASAVEIGAVEGTHLSQYGGLGLRLLRWPTSFGAGYAPVQGGGALGLSHAPCLVPCTRP